MEDLPHLQSINITTKGEHMKKEKQEQPEPTIKELLEITRIIADFAISTLNEHRQFLQNIKDMPRTQEEMELRALELGEITRETNRRCEEVQNAFIKYADLLNLDIEKAEPATTAEPNTAETRK